MDNKGQVAMAMSSAVILVLVAALVGVSVMGTIMSSEEIENISHPIEQDVATAANSIGFSLPLILIVVLIGVCIWFIVSSQMAFGGGCE